MENEDARKLANLMGMGGTAERAGNHEEAISYYNRVLEADPTYSEAWLGKGRAAGWLSSLANVRINETIVAFGHAIATADDDHKHDVAVRATTDATSIIIALYGMAQRHHVQHATVPSARETYITSSAAMIDALHSTRDWNPRDRAALSATVAIATDLLNLGVNPQFTELLRARRDEAATDLEAIDPTYVRPDLATETTADKEKAKAEWDAIGYVVLFIVVILGAIITAATRH